MALTVLVVEDTELLRRMYADRLTQDGYTVLLAADGIEALSVLRTNTPDLILLDLMMPRMSGLEVLETVQRDPRLSAIPVLMLSNLGQDDDIKRCLDLGAVDFLIKNDARPADISARIAAAARPRPEEGAEPYRLLLRDREADAERFIADAGLTHRLWCPSCQVELSLELVPQPDRPGYYDAHLTCLMCGRAF